MCKKKTSVLLCILLLIVLILAFALRWALANYGHVSMDEIVFHLNMPLEGADANLLTDYLRTSLLPAVLIWLACLALMTFPPSRHFALSFYGRKTDRNKPLFSIQLLPLHLPAWLFAFGLFCALLSVYLRADMLFSFTDYMKNQFTRSSFIEQEYVFPEDVEITFPQAKRNLINIYIESGETSSADHASGGLMNTNYTPELTQIAKENISFSQSELIEGAAAAPGCGWTIAGLVAQTSGLPLKLPNHYNNVMSKYETFLPGAVSLGEILEKEGYHNYFMAGSDFSFGGRLKYFTAHGNYEIFDYNWAKAYHKIPEDYHVFWGFEDARLFTFAKEKLTEIAAKDEPFNFSLLTVDTHIPEGYVCDLCPHKYSSQYADVWACASAQISDFVSWLQEQPFYENTMVVITGDHLSMNSHFYGANTDDDYLGQAKRKVYNAFLNTAAEPVKETNRLFTTMDIFPTVLGGLGARIEGERLGLGTNLFSEEETLSEKYGFPKLFAELQKKSTFYNEVLLFP